MCAKAGSVLNWESKSVKLPAIYRVVRDCQTDPCYPDPISVASVGRKPFSHASIGLPLVVDLCNISSMDSSFIVFLLILTLQKQTNPCRALLAHKLPNNGYYLEEISPSLVISHYHTTYVPFNITIIKFTLSQLLRNLVIIDHMVRKQNNTLMSTQFDHFSKALNDTYDTYAKLNLHQISKLSRNERGLLNFLGSGIKFITGNLDNNDLETITQNLQTLKHNQLNSMQKINELSSFAGNIVNKFESTLNQINENSKNIRSEFYSLDKEINTMLTLQNEYIQIINLNEFLEKLLRILSFAHLETLDLEILSLRDAEEIWKYLEIHYPKNSLRSINHLSELTLICKTGLLILPQMAILVIKIPIFERNVCNLKIVYPIPNNESKVLIGPSKFYCDTLLYRRCEEVNTRWLCSDPIANSCPLPKNCQYAVVQNNYQVHTQTYKNSLPFCTKSPETIYEDCFQFQKVTLQDCYLIQSQCDVIVSQHKYSLSINNISVTLPEVTKLQDTNLSLNFQIRHLENPKLIQEDLMEPINFQDFAPQQQSYSFILAILSVIFICMLLLVIYFWQKQSRMKTIPLKTLEKIINEDVEKSEDGGVISPNQ